LRGDDCGLEAAASPAPETVPGAPHQIVDALIHVRPIRVFPPAGIDRPPVRDEEPAAQSEANLEHGADNERARGVPAPGERGATSRSADLGIGPVQPALACSRPR
jgi:hypothetical protein